MHPDYSFAVRIQRLICYTLVWLATLCFGSFVAVGSTPTRILEISAAAQEINAKYLDTERTPASEQQAFDAGVAFLAQYLDASNAAATSECLFRLLDLSGRLARRDELLQIVSDATYDLKISDRSAVGLSRYLIAVANLELNRGELDAALMLADSALAIPLPDELAAVVAAKHIVRGHIVTQKYEDGSGMPDFKRGLDLYLKSQYEGPELMSAYEACARTAAMNEDYKAAERYATKAIALMESKPVLKNSFEAYSVFLTHAFALSHQGKSSAAVEAIEEAIVFVYGVNDQPKIIKTLNAAVDVYIKAEQYQKAEEYLNVTVDLAKKMGLERETLLAYKNAVELYEKKLNFKTALAYHKLHAELKDKLNGNAKNWRLKSIQEENIKKQHANALAIADAKTEAALKEAKIASQRSIFFVCATILLGGLFLLQYRNLKTKRRHNETLEGIVESRTMELQEQTKELEKRSAQLASNAEKLKESNQDLERFAHIASHDLKTPLRNMKSFLDLTKRRLPEEAKPVVEEYIDIARTYADRMCSIVSDVLEYSTVDAKSNAEAVEVDLRQLIENLVRENPPWPADKQVKFECTGRASIMSMPQVLKQIIRNLFGNGIKYNEALFPSIQVEILDKDDTVELQIQDNGIGIAEEYHEKIFEMFQRLHNTEKYEGTGLGLAVCKKMIQKLNGEIWLESAVGQGSTFFLRLPKGGSDELVTVEGAEVLAHNA